MSESVYEYDLTNAGVFGFAGLTKSPMVPNDRRYYLNDLLLVSPYGHTVPPVVADLLDVAASILWADRQSKRPRTYNSFRQFRGWVRQFELILGVRDPDIWNDHAVKDSLEQLLTWLTEDVWHLRFEHQQGVRRQTDIQPSLFSSPPTNAVVALYSGGLDSLAGVVHLLRTYPHQAVILMSAIHHRLSSIVKEQVWELQRHFGVHRVQHALMPFHMVHVTPQREEHTQRTRGLLFLAFGVAEAVACDASRILTFENGVGMLNLPFNRRQLGTQHTRAMHPRTLLKMNHIFSLLGLSGIRCEAPYFLRTKGELCAELRTSGLGALCATTVSCDSFPLRIPRTSGTPALVDTERHCGYCTSCLLRRQAIFAAHLEQEDALVHYEVDVCSCPKVTKSSYLEPLKMMLDQVILMKKACASPAPSSALLLEFPELTAARHAVEHMPDAFRLSERMNSMEALSDLLYRYTKEWEFFPYQLRPV